MHKKLATILKQTIIAAGGVPALQNSRFSKQFSPPFSLMVMSLGY